MLHARGRCLSFRSVLCVAVSVLTISVAESADAANSVVVESKQFAPGQTACTVGVFVSNDVPIYAIVVPLEFRTVSGGAYVTGPFTSSFRFGPVPGNRIYDSPLGPAGDNWPPAITFNQRYSTPSYDRTCSGPVSNTYGTATATIDGISPDAVSFASVTAGDPSIGEEIQLPAGSDAMGTTNASFQFVLNLNSAEGCFVIDTCCCLPGIHLTMIGENDVPDLYEIPLEFDWGVIRIGVDTCPGLSDPSTNNRPEARCKDSVVVETDGSCLVGVTAQEVDDGSWDLEDGNSLSFALDPPGPYPVGSSTVTLEVCDLSGRCSSCQSRIVVRDTAEVTLVAQPQVMYFNYTSPESYFSLCQEVYLTTTGCGVAVTALEEGTLTSGPWDLTTNSWYVCLDPILAGNIPNGTYYEEIIYGVKSGPQRDTVEVVIVIDHPYVEPGCDSVSGFVLSLSGTPIEHALVGAATYDATWTNFRDVPGAHIYTNENGEFRLHTNRWPRLALRVSHTEYNVAVTLHPCEVTPTYIYLEPGSSDALIPMCATHGFVFSPSDVSPRTPVESAVVELWDSYPNGAILSEDSTNALGHFGLGNGSGQVIVRARGFCPTVVQDVHCKDVAAIITLDPLPYSEPEDWPYFTDYHSTNATIAGMPIQPGDAIYATDPQGVICGATWVDDPGAFSIRVIGDDPSTSSDEGAVPGDLITLWLNCDYVATAPAAWENAGSSEFDLAWSTESDADIDILPGVCPNVIDTGVTQLPGPIRPEPAGGAPPEEPSIEVAILGTASLDAANVDLTSVQFEGLSPLSHRLADVSRPPSLETLSECACPETGSDGLVDLVLKFNQRELLDALGELHDGEVRTLTLAGNTKRGRALSGTNCLTVKFGPTRVDPRDTRRLPGKFGLATYPNPFNAETMVSFSLEVESRVRVDVFNVLGSRVASLIDDILPAGEHRAAWNAAGMASGMYFVRLATAQGQVTKKVVLVR